MSNGYAVEMKDITKKFGGLTAVDKVSFQVKPGEIHALCGENGAGKSTLMNVLTGKFPANSYSGEILLNGKKTKIGSPMDAKRDKITNRASGAGTDSRVKYRGEHLSRQPALICHRHRLEEDVRGGGRNS